MRIWNDKKERTLLILMIAIFAILCLIEANFSLIKPLHNTVAGKVLVNSGVKNISSNLVISILAAYFFYLFIDFMPRVRREEKTEEVLNALLAAVLDSYNRCRMFGHETAISHVKKDVLDYSWLKDEVSVLKGGKAEFLKLKFAMQTSYTRIDDFRHALPLAVSLSPEKTMQWLVIIDKIRLFSESYGEQPEVTEDKLHLVDKDTDENPLKDYKLTLNFRFLELLEQTQLWLGYEPKNIG
ncbi:MAG: hypothetical protein V7745_00560 [Pseudomonadales bacterium]